MTSLGASADELKEAGNRKFTAGDYEGAVRLYTGAIAACETAPSAVLHSNRANAYLKLEEFGAALSDATRAVELDPRYPKAYYRRASALFALGKKRDALRDFASASRLVPGSAEARAKLAEVERVVRREAFEAAISAGRERPLWQELEDTFDDAVPPPPPEYAGPRLSRPPKPDEIRAMVAAFRQQERIHQRYAYGIALDALRELRKEKALVDVAVPDGTSITVCGDVHGQFFDLAALFEREGYPSESNPFLFNGDFVDRGSWSVEVVLTLLALKAAHPGAVHLARGNHETLNMNRMYGFEGEVKAKLGERMFELFTELFCWLPLAHVLGGKVFVVHGGLFSSPEGTVPSLDEIRRIDRVK
jgi:serine/threonine-protein phosphatase 5